MISIEPIPGKGLGVRAQRDFSPGEVIITEEVLIHCSRLHEVEAREPTAEQARQIYQKFNRLSTAYVCMAMNKSRQKLSNMRSG